MGSSRSYTSSQSRDLLDGQHKQAGLTLAGQGPVNPGPSFSNRPPESVHSAAPTYTSTVPTPAASGISDLQAYLDSIPQAFKATEAYQTWLASRLSQ